ncbi:hypothetical protein PU630_00220 [Microbacterium horticulturae]|uniref:ABC transporter permease n=1 Tax=Microbacterium horticulturae TaxID=3028316 RepID=A0ABY8C104_9MICO|nr:hypothetical protein [Microbacterium sp. KACC 23027]WEG09022.1 hypothetical protein PU630_00220 [Microbacterium sp. KACC 23027]
MTALTQTASATPRGRIVNVVRMQFVNRMTFVWIPLIILAAVFVFSMVIWLMIPYGGPKYSGGAQALIWYLLAVGIQSLTLTFPFSQAMSVTRREFFFGTYLTAALTAALLAVVTTVGGLIESATGGWGLNGWMFYTDWTWASGPLGSALSVFALAMLTFTAGFWCATIYKRFGGIGLTLVLVGVGALLLVALWIIGRFNAWAAVFGWLASLGVVPLSLVVLAIVVVLAATEFWMLRRLTP